MPDSRWDTKRQGEQQQCPSSAGNAERLSKFHKDSSSREWLAHVCVSRKPTGLDTERQDIGRTEDRRSVGLVCDQACRRCHAQRFVERLHYPDSESSERITGRRGLADYVTSRWHLFAAVLTVMTMPHALHRLAALHRLLSCRHRSAVERIGPKSNCEHSRQDVSRKTHLN